LIALDARMVGHSGIGAFLRTFLSGLSAAQWKNMTLLGDPRKLSSYPAPVVAARESIYGLGEQVVLPWRLKKLKPELLHVPHYNVPLAYGGPLVVTVHDLIHLLFPAFSRRPLARQYASFLLSRISRKAVRIMADSGRTRDDLIRFGVPSEKIIVVSLAVDRRFRPVPSEEWGGVLRDYGLAPGYILYVGNIRKIKNIPRLVEAYRALKRRRPDAPPLVLAGRDQMPEESAAWRSDPSIKMSGKVNEADLPALYSAAGLFVFPSLYEGFGLPPLEAMACGCPVAASTGGSLPEVLGDAALLSDPLNAEALADSMERLLSDSVLRGFLVRKGLERARFFQPEKMVEKVFAVYRGALSARAAREVLCGG
jgi:glycosyltransferase involved in cell wall biosynthesis